MAEQAELGRRFSQQKPLELRILTSLLAVGLFIALAIYGVLIAGLWWHLERQFRHPLPEVGEPSWPALSVIVAAHNEEATLPALLEALAGQGYPSSRWELIVAADRCTDGTVALLGRWQDRLPKIKVLEIEWVPEGWSPKKFALQQAIRQAQHDHLVLLDADVRPGPDHLQHMAAHFLNGAQAVVGLMKLQLPPGPVGRFLSFERMSNWLACLAGFALKHPFLAYGGNWAYTRTAFQGVGGFEGIAGVLSGDDDLLLQKFARQGLPVHFCSHPEGWVLTPAPTSWQQFFVQRRRHLSASSHYPPAVQLGYGLVHLLNFSLWLGALGGGTALIPLLIKLALDGALVARSAQLFREEDWQPISILWTEPLWLLYLLVFGLLGLGGTRRWR
ncbi:MAG: glycosyltransferase [Calditrichaeota bacterium]|nr:MAG: glycosyltransferase [Calditrichota bacterium]